MNGPCHVRAGPAYRPKPRRTFPTVLSIAVSCMIITVIMLFWVGHRSVMRMHTAMHSPSMGQPAGWATLHKTTTVQSATVTISGADITGSAVTATTTETQAAGTASDTARSQQAAAQATATAAEAAAAPNTSSSFTSSFAHMLGDLQHSSHAMLTAHAGWKHGDQITRAQLAAAAAASMPDAARDIELHAHKVAEVVNGAKLVQQLQQLAQGGVAALVAGGRDELTSAEASAGLYGAGGGTVAFTAAAEMATCPEGSPAVGAAQAAVVLLAGSSTAALQRSLDGLMLLYSRAGSDVRSAFHLYMALNSSSSEETRTVATSYVHDTMGAVKLVQHKSSSDGSSSISGDSGHIQVELNQLGAMKSIAGTAAKARRLMMTRTAATPNSLAGSQIKHQKGRQDKELHAELSQQPQSLLRPSKQHAGAVTPFNRDTSSSSSNSSTGNGDPSSDTGALEGPHSSHTPDHLLLMLHVFLECFQYPAVLLLDDDVKLSPDFLDFFYATNWLLGSDPSLYCLAAWNPQGHRQQAVHPARLLRSDTNPGKAWLLSRSSGRQLLAQWQQHGQLSLQHNESPASSGDASHAELVRWLSSDVIRGGRQCLVPELPRVTPAGADETFPGAHTHDPDAADQAMVAGHQHVLLAAADYTINTGAPHSSAGSPSSFGEEGAVDLAAYLDDEAGGSDDLIAGNDASQVQVPVLQLQDGLSPDAGDADGSRQQQQQQQQDPASQGPHHRAAWLHKDLSVLLEDNYELYVHQALLNAQACNVTDAATIEDTHLACVVAYDSAAHLSAAAAELGMPVMIDQGIKYCYQLPAAAPAARQQHCQEFMPQMAYQGILTGYNRYNVSLYLAHSRFLEAVQQLRNNSAAVAAALGPEL